MNTNTVTSFAQLNLNPPIFKAIEYKEPTPIQARAIPEILKEKDVVASAETGTGKTAAFVLPMLHRLTAKKGSHKPRVLILSPTRELATQISQAILKYSKFMKINTVSLVGGMPYNKQIKGLSRSLDIIIATPGRLMDHMEKRRVDLSSLEMLILDEADRMLDMGFIDDVRAIAKATPQSRQTLLFSATVDDRLKNVINQLLKNPTRISVAEQKKLTPKLIKQEIYHTDNPGHKTKVLHHILANSKIYKGIIFTATKISADRLAKQLRDLGYEASPLHGDLKQNLRNKTIEALKKGRIQYLVATDVAARGIDISDITHVINYDLPRFSEDYVHRIGRTGRAGKEGVAISLVLPTDTRHLQRIERYIGLTLPQCTIEGLEPKNRFSAATPAHKKKRVRGNKPQSTFGAGGKSFGGRSFGKKKRPAK